MIYSWKQKAIFWASFVEVGKINAGPPLAIGFLNQHRVCKPRKVEGFFDEIDSEELVHLVLQGLISLSVHCTTLLSDRLLVRVQVEGVEKDRRSIPSMSECFQANTSRFSLRKVEITSLSSLDRFFSSFSTFVG